MSFIEYAVYGSVALVLVIGPMAIYFAYKSKEDRRLCQCELTGMVEVLSGSGCELCNYEMTAEANRENLLEALRFTKNQVDALTYKTKHPDASSL